MAKTSPSPEPLDEATRRRLRRQRQRDTGPEMAVRRALFAVGLRYRVHARLEPDLRVRADIVFPRARIAIFVDGCYWHGCPTHGTAPKNNAQWWEDKIAANRRRDAATDELLATRGWRVLRFWEHDQAAEVVDVIRNALRAPTLTLPPR